MSGLDDFSMLGKQANLIPSINQGHGQPVWVGTPYSNHIALAPDFELKITINF
jgi:hypothetical protein